MWPPFDPIATAEAASSVAAATQLDGRRLHDLQGRRLTALLQHAQQHAPRYRTLLKGERVDRLSLTDLPITTKAQWMAAFDDGVCDPALHLPELRRFAADPARVANGFLGRYVVWESSGSSGEPGLYVQDARAMAVYDALESVRRAQLRQRRHPLDPCGLQERVAFVGATGGHFASYVSLQRLRRLNPWAAAQMSAVSFLQPPQQLAAQLEALAPTVVATYPTMAAMLADWQRAGALHLSLHEVWTGGETLTPVQRRAIESGFGCALANSYGASEFLSLAFECSEGRLHLNSDWAILESLDAQRLPVPPGTAGCSSVLTNLANAVQPLIRYELGDRVTFATAPCRCGCALPVIDVLGRCDDTLVLPATGGREVAVSPLALTTVLEDDAGLFDFQLVQHAPAELALSTPQRGRAATEALRKARTALTAFLAVQGAPGVHVHCHAGRLPRAERSGKVLRVVALPRPPRPH